MSKYPAGSTAKVYYDIDGNETTLYRLVRAEPDWAMSRIVEGEKAIVELTDVEAVLEAAREIKSEIDGLFKKPLEYITGNQLNLYLTIREIDSKGSKPPTIATGTRAVEEIRKRFVVIEWTEKSANLCAIDLHRMCRDLLSEYDQLRQELKEALEEVEICYSYRDQLGDMRVRAEKAEAALYLETVKNNSNVARVEFLEGKRDEDLERISYLEKHEYKSRQRAEKLDKELYSEIVKNNSSLARVEFLEEKLKDTDKGNSWYAFEP